MPTLPSLLSMGFFPGFGLGAGFIVAIGAQNALVLKQGLLRRHVGLVVALCASFDILLIAAGVGGMSRIVSSHPGWLSVIRYGGALFLFAYGLRAAWSAYRGGAHLRMSNSAHVGAWGTALTTMALSAGNPHVYLDTVLLLGSIGGRLDWPIRAWFAAGAMCASVCWFSMLGWGARLLSGVFAHELAWRVLDGLIALIMWSIALSLLIDR